MTVEPDLSERSGRALRSLRGLSVGDALGSQLSLPSHHRAFRHGHLPSGPWRWSDDTEMSSSVVAVLVGHGRIDQDALARSFADHHDTGRGYGRAADRMLRLIRQEGAGWRELAAALFNGEGSWGNGAAMRVAPLGAWYADDPERAVQQAELSAYTTHQHREGTAGAMAVAAAAALAGAGGSRPAPADLLAAVADLVPRSAVQDGLRKARDLLGHDDAAGVATVLGCGRHTSAHDTVPFALWAAVRHLDDFEGALRAGTRADGDLDTTCAIVGGVLASGPDGGPPADWQRRTEPLPDWVRDLPAAPR